MVKAGYTEKTRSGDSLEYDENGKLMKRNGKPVGRPEPIVSKDSPKAGRGGK